LIASIALHGFAERDGLRGRLKERVTAGSWPIG
jgi:hypothetical protein